MKKLFDTIGWIALLLVILGALNWMLIGIWEYDLVAEIFGAGADLTRAVYIVVGVAGLYLFGYGLASAFTRSTFVEGPKHIGQH
ncbi:MAG: DUF378 domain-containing protein [Gaiellales bacterium]|nr:MAG: DUF378 domain-containing protein [Gaiellales bacterium]